MSNESVKDITEQDLRLTGGLPGSEKSEVKAGTSVKATATSSTKQAPKPVFTKKENATLAQRIEILDWHHKNGGNQTATAKHFDSIYPNLTIKQPLVSAWLKNETRWRAEWEQASSDYTRTAKRPRQTQHPAITEMMDLWVTQAMAHGIDVTGDVLRHKWRSFADRVGIPEEDRLNLSDGWLSKFKARAGLKEFKRHGEAASADAATVEHERRRVQELIRESGYELRDIFNMDETGLFYAYVPCSGFSEV